MSDTALRLADALEQQFPMGTAQHYLDGEAAAELRRLHAKCEALTAGVLEEMDRINEIHRLRALNAELVEALRGIVEWAENSADWGDLPIDAAYAALANVEASK